MPLEELTAYRENIDGKQSAPVTAQPTTENERESYQVNFEQVAKQPLPSLPIELAGPGGQRKFSSPNRQFQDGGSS